MTTGYQYTIREMQMVLVAAALASFLSPFLGSMVNVAIPAIGEAYVATAESLAMLSTAYLISSVMFMVPAARIADIWQEFFFLQSHPFLRRSHHQLRY